MSDDVINQPDNTIPQDYQRTASPVVAVLGVGSVLLTDEGLGVHIVNELQKEYSFSPEVRLLDGGTMGMELLYYIKDVDRLILVDAMKGNGAPGTIYELQRDQILQYFSGTIDAHEVGMKDVINIRNLDETHPMETVVIGVEPSSLEIGLEVSPVVAQTLPRVKSRILDILASWDVSAKEL